MHELPSRLTKRFEMIRVLQSDAVGSVFEVRDRDSKQTATLRWFPTADPRVAAACAGEFELLRGLNHPHVTSVSEFGRDGDGCYLVREFIPGDTLGALGPELDEVNRRRVFVALLSGLAALHSRGVLHGDLKPDNVLIRVENGCAHAVLTDFGLASRLGSQPGVARGTPPFIAPEVLLGFAPDERSDLFSLAVTWLASGERRPEIDTRKLYERFPRDDFVAALGVDLDALDPEFAPLLRWMLSTAPDERPRSAIELLDRLGATVVVDPRQYVGVLRPSSAFFEADGGSRGEAIEAAEALVARRGSDRSILLFAASPADASAAEAWLRFHAAREGRPPLDSATLSTALAHASLAEQDPTGSRATRQGRDAAIARVLVAGHRGATIIVPPDLVALRDGSFAQALSRAARTDRDADVAVVAIVCDPSRTMRPDASVAGAFDLVAELPVLGRDHLALHMARCEDPERPVVTERLASLADRLLELAGPDADAIGEWFESGLEDGTIVYRRGRADFSRFEPRGTPRGLEERLSRHSPDERRILLTIALLGGTARRDELTSARCDANALARLRATGTLSGGPELLRVRPPALADCAFDRASAAERASAAAEVGRLDHENRPTAIRAVITACTEGAGSIRDLDALPDTDVRAIPILGRLVAVLPPRSAARSVAAMKLARMLADAGRLGDAIARLEAIAAEGCDDSKVESAVLTRLGLVLHASSRTDAAWEPLERAKALLRELRGKAPAPLRREVERGLALVRAARGDVAGAIQQLQLVLRGSGDEPDADERGLAVLLGALALRDGKFAAARRTLETTLGAARRQGDHGIVAAAATNLSTLEQREGALDKAIDLLDEALAIRVARGDLFEEAVVRNNLGLAKRENGDLEGALRELAESHALRLRMGDERGAATVALNLAGIESLRGDFDHAVQLAVNASRILRSLGIGANDPETQIAAARLLEIRRYVGGREDLSAEADALAGLLPAESSGGGAAIRRASGERKLAAAAAEDDPAAALRLAREAATAFEQAGDRIGLSRAAIEIARRLVEREDLDGARNELARAKRLAPPRVEPELHLVSALLAETRGIREEALSEITRASEVARRIGTTVAHGEALLREIALRSGNDARQISSLKDELRQLASRFRLPGEVGLPALAVLRRIYGKLVAPDLTMDSAEIDVETARGDDRVLTAGIPEEVFRTFVMINRSVLREKDLDRLLERLLEHAVALSGARRGFVVLLNDGRVVCEARSGELEPENEEISRGIVVEAIQQMRPLVTANAKSDTRLTGRKSIERFDLRSVLCVPFRCYSGTEGAIYVDNPVREGVFGTRAVDFLEALASQAAIAIGNIERSREIERLNEELKQRVSLREAELDQARRELVKTGVADGARRLIAQSDAMKQVVDLARRVAKSDLPVLVLGESGTGKEMLARFVHDASARCARAFVAENCSAIPETLLESEFFGCVKGAFTGADQDRDGLFQQANGGTLFLDEIGDMPLALQAKLLRVLQEKAVRKVGSPHTTPVDVRLVCATHRDLEAMVAEGKFREDLYYRVRGVVLPIPPLRDRRDDIPALAEAVLERLNVRHGTTKRAGKPLLKKLLQHDWPGNVRELESEMTRLYHLAEGDEIGDTGFEPRRKEAGNETDSSVIAVRPMDEIERDAIRLALRETGGNREEAARRLGISRAAFYVKLKNYGLHESSPPSRRRKS